MKSRFLALILVIVIVLMALLVTVTHQADAQEPNEPHPLCANILALYIHDHDYNYVAMAAQTTNTMNGYGWTHALLMMHTDKVRADLRNPKLKINADIRPILTMHLLYWATFTDMLAYGLAGQPLPQGAYDKGMKIAVTYKEARVAMNQEYACGIIWDNLPVSQGAIDFVGEHIIPEPQTNSTPEGPAA